MKNFIIFTDSACDIKNDLLKEWGVTSIDLSFNFTDNPKQYKNNEINPDEFYKAMRKGAVAKTSAVNMGEFKAAFEQIVKQGTDILYLGFSSGLSATYNSAVLAAEELIAEYSSAKILCADTLCASAGFGMLLKAAVDLKNEGADIDAVYNFVEQNKLNMCHWFTVEDLVYLKRGGRISPTLAFVGSVLGVKPVLHMDNEGHLVNCFKVRGRKAAITALADKFSELSKQVENGRIYISHADCISDAKLLADILSERHGVKCEIITDVGPVIGAHSGPGTLALFFFGTER